MTFLSWVLKSLADEYVMPQERYISIWETILKVLNTINLPKTGDCPGPPEEK